jgi:hypothetical protein
MVSVHDTVVGVTSEVGLDEVVPPLQIHRGLLTTPSPFVTLVQLIEMITDPVPIDHHTHR